MRRCCGWFGVLWLLVNVALAQDSTPERKDSIIVTGTYDPLPLKESDRAVTVYTLEDNKRLLFGSVVDVLRLDPSIDLQQRAPDGVQADLSIRGGTFAQTLVLLNGFRLDDAQSAHHDMDIPVPLQAISSVEILKGSGSAYYGSDAVDGAINIIARPPDSSEFRLRSGVGNFGVNQESARLSLVENNIAEELSFSRDFSTGFMPDRDYRNLQLASLTHWKTKLGATDLLLSTGDKPFGANQFYGDFDSWERTRQWFASIRQELGSKTEFDFGYRRHTDLFVLYREDPQYYTNRHADETYQTAVRRSDSLRLNTTVHYGVEGYRDTIASNNLGNHQRNRAAAYGSIDFRALGRFSLSIGAREELYTLASNPGTHAELSPTISGGVWILPTFRFRASASSAFRLPSYTDLYYSDPANVGNPNLRPEHATTYEGGVEWFHGPRFRAYATLFNRRDRDGIDYVLDQLTAVWQAENIDRLNFTGIETGVSARLPHAQQLDVQYTALHGVQDGLEDVITKYTFNYPSQNASVAWQAALPKGFVARTRVGALNRRARSPYALWDLYAASTLGRVHPFLQLTNLTNTSYQEILGIQMQSRAVVGGVEWAVFGKTR